MQSRRTERLTFFVSILLTVLGWSSGAFADESIRGVITEHRIDGTLMVQTNDSGMMVIVVNDWTKVRRDDGMRTVKVSSAELTPGLRVHVKGDLGIGNKLVADKVHFSRSDQKLALAIWGGVAPTDQRSLANQRRIEQNAQAIEQQQLILDRQAQQIAANRGQISANEQRIVATSGALAATSSRIADLDNYDVVETMTVYFGNGRASIAPKYKTQLQQLAAHARGVQAYMVQVQGYASAVGSNALNQKLSLQRATAVAAVLQQSGVPPTNIAVPAAMGITDQVATNKTANGQAENRRAVVTLLQNKGIADKK